MSLEKPKFSPAGYLRGLGWGGPGEGLNDSPHARAKPITVQQKKTLAGVGKDRDTAFPWWEMVFATVASKAASGEKANHHRTQTGIISHLPPPAPSAYQSMTPSAGGLLGEAKREAARRQLYSGFLRGTVVEGTKDDDDESLAQAKRDRERVAVVPLPTSTATSTDTDDAPPKPKKSKRSRPTPPPLDSSTEEDLVVVSHEDTIPEERPKKKKRKAVVAEEGPQHLSPEEVRVQEEEAYAEAREIAKRAAKEERRLERVVRRALRDAKKGAKDDESD